MCNEERVLTLNGWAIVGCKVSCQFAIYNFHVKLDNLLSKPNVFEIELNIFKLKTSSFHIEIEALQEV